ncbi:MAG: hypothetical protein QOK25_2755 [Thermoleophilaceae bacterium]|jgi:hypothetical protein|nr:hypothetical protein [Thermoleophilaceae bacterium]
MTALRAGAGAAAALTAGLALALAGSAFAKTTPNFNLTSNGTAVSQGAVVGAGAAGSYQDFPFTIAGDEADGDISVHIDWVNPADDFDLYIYRKGPGNELETVGSSAGAPPSTEENAVAQSQGVPITPGQYVIRVQNYASTVPNFKGTAHFGVFTPPNEIPIAKLAAPATVKAGRKVRLDASASHDPDGSIANYAFDLDGNGSVEVNNGNNPVLSRALSPGLHHVAVRVTDNKGLRAFANRDVVVQKKHKKKGKKKH